MQTTCSSPRRKIEEGEGTVKENTEGGKGQDEGEGLDEKARKKQQEKSKGAKAKKTIPLTKLN